MKPSNNVYFLLVDDLEENLVALEALLRREGLTILKARNGQDALELLLIHDVALAILDVQMPGMSGFELAELMRGTEKTRRIPIVFVTAGIADMQRKFRGYEAGAVDFLTKPIEPDILRSKAEVFFDLYRQRQEVAAQRDELKEATLRIQALLEESKRQATALRDADQRKDEFLAMLAHELRNPLAPIRNAVEVLRQSGLEQQELDEARDIIARQARHMSRLVDDLLDVARIVRGKIELRRSRCDVVEIVRKTSEDYRPTLVSAGQTLEISLPDHPLYIDGDPIRLSQVVGNLLHNAGKFTPSAGSIEVSVRELKPTSTVEVKVTDSGIGFDQSNFQRMLEPFSQADQSIDRKGGGLGLGLALSKGIIELHGGKIQGESAGHGQGSAFTLLIPLAVGVQEVTKTVNKEEVSVQPLRVMLVEDNVDAARMLQLLLAAAGHTVHLSHSGEAALQTFADFAPDVILSDLGLPGGIDGYELARKLRSLPFKNEAYLVALSGYGQENDRKRTADAGFDAHLVKPVDFSELQKTLAAARPWR